MKQRVGRLTSGQFQIHLPAKLPNPTNLALIISVALAMYFFILTVTGTRNIALALACTSFLLPIQIQRSLRAKRAREIARSWPEIVDQLVSGIQSGLSLNESVMALSLRGPQVMRDVFSRITESQLQGNNFEQSMEYLKAECQSVEADQIAETLIIARTLGGRDVGIVLRLLGDFFRENLVLRDEISAKHGWIRNSAVLAACAPWLLLLILATQPSTRMTYSTPTGFFVLCSGAVATITAFIWMNIVGRIPQPVRIFANRVDQ